MASPKRVLFLFLFLFLLFSFFLLFLPFSSLVPSPLSPLPPPSGGLITKKDVGKEAVDKRIGWGLDGNGNWKFFVPRAADGSPLLDERELKDRLASGNRQYGFSGRSNIVRLF